MIKFFFNNFGIPPLNQGYIVIFLKWTKDEKKIENKEASFKPTLKTLLTEK